MLFVELRWLKPQLLRLSFNRVLQIRLRARFSPQEWIRHTDCFCWDFFYERTTRSNDKAIQTVDLSRSRHAGKD